MFIVLLYALNHVFQSANKETSFGWASSEEWTCFWQYSSNHVTSLHYSLFCLGVCSPYIVNRGFQRLCFELFLLGSDHYHSSLILYSFSFSNLVVTIKKKKTLPKWMGQGMMIDGNDISIHQLNPKANIEILQYYAAAESITLQVEIFFPLSKWRWALILKDATVGQSMDFFFFLSIKKKVMMSWQIFIQLKRKSINKS